jgi:hypothetical protein
LIGFRQPPIPVIHIINNDLTFFLSKFDTEVSPPVHEALHPHGVYIMDCSISVAYLKRPMLGIKN